MDFMTSALLGGLTYDFVKAGLDYSTRYIVSSLKKEIADEYKVSDETLEEIVEQLQGLSEQQRETQHSLEQAIQSNVTLQALLSRVQPIDQSTTVNQSISGSHAKVAGRDFHDHSQNTILPEKKNLST